MFWKNVNFQSLILRLTLLYITSIMTILLIISGVLYFSLKSDLQRNEHKLLQSVAVFINQLDAPSKHSIIHYLHHEKAETLEDYWETLIITSCFGVFVSAFLGIFLAYRSMRPMKIITNAMKKTTISQLKTRLNVEKNWPKEFTELSEHFNAMLDRLEMSFNRLSQFSADLAHELRTPINNLKGEAEISLIKARSPEEYQQVIGSSLEEYERLSRIIESVLFLARAETPHNKLVRTHVSLRKTIEKILAFYTPMAEEKSILLTCIGDEKNTLTLYVNESLFQRVIHNLLSNALRYTPQEGTITVNISSQENKIIIQIIDTGLGIAQEHLSHLFERFYRTDAARAQESGGSGLGLSIVKSIMDLHEATITIDSLMDKGTTVSLVFC